MVERCKLCGKLLQSTGKLYGDWKCPQCGALYGWEDGFLLKAGWAVREVQRLRKRVIALERALSPSDENLTALGIFLQYELGEQMPTGIRTDTLKTIMAAILKQASKPEQEGE